MYVMLWLKTVQVLFPFWTSQKVPFLCLCVRVPPPSSLTWLAGKSTMNESMYGSYWKYEERCMDPIENEVIFQPVMLVFTQGCKFCSWTFCWGMVRSKSLELINSHQPSPWKNGCLGNYVPVLGKAFIFRLENVTPPKFASLPLKNDGWKITFLLGWFIFRGYVKLPGSNFREFIACIFFSLPEIPGCCGCNLFFVDKNLDDYTPEKVTNVLKKGAISKGKDRLPTTIFGGCNHSWYLYLGSQKWSISFLWMVNRYTLYTSGGEGILV